MTNKKVVTTSMLAAGLLALVTIPLMDEAFASCWWCGSGSHDSSQQLHFQVGYQHECDRGWGNCVTMSGHWQPIKEGKADQIGFKVKGDHDWIKPIIQTKTKEVSVRGVWDVHSTVVDKYNNSLGGGDKKAVAKQYYYERLQTQTMKKVIADIEKDDLIFQVITVRSIT